MHFIHTCIFKISCKLCIVTIQFPLFMIFIKNVLYKKVNLKNYIHIDLKFSSYFFLIHCLRFYQQEYLHNLRKKETIKKREKKFYKHRIYMYFLYIETGYSTAKHKYDKEIKLCS